jgi:hypothetical protein
MPNRNLPLILNLQKSIQGKPLIQINPAILNQDNEQLTDQSNNITNGFE